MSEIKIKYAASADVTITLASLGSDTTFLAGRESAEVDNSSNLYLDMALSGKITAGTSPTASREIRVYLAAIMNDTPEWPDVLDGTDSAETITSAEIRDSGLVLAASILTTNTSDRVYPFSCRSVAALFGGVLPKKFVVFVTHSTGVALNATGSNHKISYYGITETVA